MKIVLLGQWTYPEQKPRAQRTWQLGVQLAREGHDVTLYALLGPGSDYTSIENSCGLKVRNLGFSKNGLTDSEGHRKKRLFSSIVKNILNEYEVFPGCDFKPMVRNVLAQEGPIDLLVSIASPHAIHWAVADCIDRAKVGTWVADCGDPFMFNPFIKPYGWLAKVEKRWCSRCDYITVPLEAARNSYYPEFSEKIKVIPQGFDFHEVELPTYVRNKVPTFVFSGRAYAGLRDPGKFLDYLSTSGKEFLFRVFTNSPELFPCDAMPGKMDVKGFIQRTELLKELARADFLVNITNPSSVQSPSKLIDYGLSGRPVLDISSGFTEEEKGNFEAFLDGDYSSAHRIPDMSSYDIVNVAKAFTDLTKR
ncbi:MAG: glycosyltransferase [Bacteroidales bacterium]|nr:glycosyltransferase [Bacteroidales bacterium]